MDAACIELDALADAVRTRAQDHDFAAVRRRGFVFLLVRRVEVGSRRFEFGGARVDAFVDRTNAECVTLFANLVFGSILEFRDLTIAKSVTLPAKHM